MSMERARRERFAPQKVPNTWEIPAAIAAVGLLLLIFVPLVVQGLMASATTGRFVWPTGHLDAALGGLLHGHFGGGLRAGTARSLPANGVLWVLTVLAEVTVLAVAVSAGRWLYEMSGGRCRHGLASATVAAEALGLPRLRKTAAVIRPDLYGHGGRDRLGGLRGDRRGGWR